MNIRPTMTTKSSRYTSIESHLRLVKAEGYAMNEDGFKRHIEAEIEAGNITIMIKGIYRFDKAMLKEITNKHIDLGASKTKVMWEPVG
jgi:hypothetical protein